MFTPGNVDDREPLKQGKFLENIKGKLCADKGYIPLSILHQSLPGHREMRPPAGSVPLPLHQAGPIENAGRYR